MRTGAIFARGSCRALKWMALVGVVFVLGAGSALAQVSVSVPKTVDEAGKLTISLAADVRVPGTVTADVDVSVTVSVAAGIAKLSEGLTVAELADAVEPDYRAPADPALTWTIKANNDPDDEAQDRQGLTEEIDIQILPDLDAEDEALTVRVTLSGVGDLLNEDSSDQLALDSDSTGAFAVTIKDDEVQSFEFEVTTTNPREGADADIDVKLSPKYTPVQMMYTVPLSLEDAVGYTLEDATVELGDLDPASTADTIVEDVTIMITPPDSDGDRDDDEITLRGLKEGTTSDLLDPLTIEVADIHKLPADDKITAKAFQDDGKGKITKNEAMSVMEGGDPVHVTITVDRGDDDYPSGEKLKVEVMAADPAHGGDYRVDDDEFLLDTGKGKQSMDIKLWARDDDDVGEEMLMLNLVVSGAKDDNGPGQSMGMFSIMIEDATTPMVSVKDGAYDAIMMALGDDPLNPGDMVEIMTDDLFMVMDGYTTSYATSIEGSAVSGSTSGDKVMLTAEDDGEAKVTVTATATPMSDSLVITQDRANVAQVTFPVMVDLKELMITLSGPEDMNVVEGMSYEIMAEANRPVEMDTMVELVQTDGTASPSDYEVESITIMAGEKMGSTMLMATEDDMMEEGEMLTLEGRFADDQDGDAVKTNAVMFYLWDAAVPALPIIAQLLLAAFLALGGYRRYLRR